VDYIDTTCIPCCFIAIGGSCISPRNGASYLNVAVDAILGFQRGQLPIRRHARAPTDISPSRIPFLSRNRGAA
jgi:hypothetical protein